MEELVVSAHEFESFSKWYRYREPVVSGCVQGVSSTRNIQAGSHRQFKHPSKPGKVTIAVHALGDDLTPGVEKSILKQAGLLK